MKIQRSAGNPLLRLLRSAGLPVSKWNGIVSYVYDPNKTSPPWGDNDQGMSVKLPNGNELFGINTEDLELLSRSESYKIQHDETK